VEVPDSPSLDFDGYFTILYWLRPDVWEGYEYTPVLSKMIKGSTYGFMIERWGSQWSWTGVLNFIFNEPNQGDLDNLSNGIPSPGVWEHWAIVFTPTGSYNPQFRWYRNGVHDASRTGFPSGDYSNDIPLRLGHSIGSTHHLDGALDELRIYERALDATEIDAIYEDESSR